MKNKNKNRQYLVLMEISDVIDEMKVLLNNKGGVAKKFENIFEKCEPIVINYKTFKVDP